MNNLQVFNNNEFGKLEILIDEDSKELFPTTECAKVLGYTNPQKAIRDHCRLDGVTNRSVGVITGVKANGTPAYQNVNTKFINEGNLYRLIVRSKLKAAERFEKWVFDEVLPTIRKTGKYEIPQTLSEALALAANIQKQLEEQKPKVIFADAADTAETSILIGDLAKLIKQNGIDIGQNRLFDWMRNNGYLMKTGSSKNMPTQKSMEKGLFEVKERTINKPDGFIRITKTTKVTGRGQIYFINEFLEYVGVN